MSLLTRWPRSASVVEVRFLGDDWRQGIFLLQSTLNHAFTRASMLGDNVPLMVCAGDQTASARVLRGIDAIADRAAEAVGFLVSSSGLYSAPEALPFYRWWGAAAMKLSMTAGLGMMAESEAPCPFDDEWRQLVITTDHQLNAVAAQITALLPPRLVDDDEPLPV